MKRVIGTALLGCMALAIVGCSASANVDPPRDNASNVDVKKTTYRDTNGNVTETKVQKQYSNP